MPGTINGGAVGGGGDFTNPMTTAADIIVGGVDGDPARLAKGTALQVLRMNSGATAQEWAAATPLTTRGDLIRGGVSGVPERVALGAAGTILRSNGTDIVYTTATFPTTAARGTILAATGTNAVTAVAAQTADTFVGGDGTDVTTRTVAQVLASLFPVASVSLASGVGWTDDVVGAGSSAAITGGAIALETGGSGVLARIGRAVPWGAGVVQVLCRVSAASLAAADELAIFLCHAVNGADAVGLSLLGDGTLIVRSSAAAAGAVAVSGMLAGNGWMRVDLAGGRIDAYAGEGGADPPTSWTRIGFAALANGGVVGWEVVRWQLNSAAAATASIGDVRYRVVTP